MPGVLVILLMFSAIATADTCHDIDRHDALQDVAMRWLADHDNPATMETFARLSRNWGRPGFYSTNFCLDATVTEDLHFIAVFEPKPPTDMEKAVQMGLEWMDE